MTVSQMCNKLGHVVNIFFALCDLLASKHSINNFDGKPTIMHASSGGEGMDLNNASLFDS